MSRHHIHRKVLALLLAIFLFLPSYAEPRETDQTQCAQADDTAVSPKTDQAQNAPSPPADETTAPKTDITPQEKPPMMNESVALPTCRPCPQPQGPEQPPALGYRPSALFDMLNTIGTLLIALFAILLWRSTNRLWEASNDQAIHLEGLVAGNSRAASAVEKIANSIKATTDAAEKSVATTELIADRQQMVSKMEMRAYLSVMVGDAATHGTKIEAKPVLINNGKTPAKKIAYWAAAEFHDWPLPADFDYPMPKGESSINATLAPKQTAFLSAKAAVEHDKSAKVAVEQDKTEGEKPKRGGKQERRLCVWGQVSYEDVFGDLHTTNFCHGLYWGKEGRKDVVLGTYADRHNDSD